MSANDVSHLPRPGDRIDVASFVLSLAAAALFLGSALLQFIASHQRWIVFRGSIAPDEISAEDHLFDYDFPSEPWESIGTAAQLFGVGALLQALAVLAMAFSVLFLSGEAGPRHDVISVAEIMIAVVVSAFFWLCGAHAFVSGVIGAPSLLSSSWTFWLLELLGIPGLFGLAVLWRRKSPAATSACVFLIGSTLGGYIVANFFIAPIFAGYVSHDTTPWTETVIAVSTAGAGLSMIFAAGMAARSQFTIYHRIRRSEWVVKGWASLLFWLGFGPTDQAGRTTKD